MRADVIWGPLNKMAPLHKYKKARPAYLQIQTTDLQDNIVYN